MLLVPLKGGLGLEAWIEAKLGRDDVGTGGGVEEAVGRLEGIGGGTSSLFMPNDRAER